MHHRLFPVVAVALLAESALAVRAGGPLACTDRHSFKYATYSLERGPSSVVARIKASGFVVGGLANTLGVTTPAWHFTAVDIRLSTARCRFDDVDGRLVDCYETAKSEAVFTDVDGGKHTVALDSAQLRAWHVIKTTIAPGWRKSTDQLEVTLWFSRADSGGKKTGTAAVEFLDGECR